MSNNTLILILVLLLVGSFIAQHQAEVDSILTTIDTYVHSFPSFLSLRPK